jgi:hypothetical protein
MTVLDEVEIWVSVLYLGFWCSIVGLFFVYDVCVSIYVESFFVLSQLFFCRFTLLRIHGV